MAKRKNDISLSAEELLTLARELETAFRSHIYTEQAFTGTKELKIYSLLKDDILDLTEIMVSTATLRNIMTLKHNRPIRADIFGAFRKYINAFCISYITELKGYQKIFWGVNQGLTSGAYIGRLDGDFIEWKDLKKELDLRVISQCPRLIPIDSYVDLKSFYQKTIGWL